MKEQITAEINKIKKEFYVLVKEQGKQKIITYLYFIFSLAAVTIFGFFAIAPTLSTISDLHKEKDDGEFTLKQLKTKVQSLQKLSSQYQLLESDLDKLYEAIPTSPKIPELIRKIEFIANKHNLVIQSLTTGPIELYPTTRTGTQLFSYTVNISTVGTESSINAFTQEVINFDRMLSIERLNSGKAEKKLFSTTIIGRAYFIKE